MIDNTDLNELLKMATAPPRTMKGKWKFFVAKIKKWFK